MKLKTNQFGELEIEENNIVTFSEGIIGFEEYHRYIIISDAELDPILWLLSIEEPDLEFPLVNPFLFFSDYAPSIKFSSETEVIFNLITLKKDFDSVTINLKGPVIIDLEKKIGRQVILESDQYHTNHQIFNLNKARKC